MYIYTWVCLYIYIWEHSCDEDATLDNGPKASIARNVLVFVWRFVDVFFFFFGCYRYIGDASFGKKGSGMTSDFDLECR